MLVDVDLEALAIAFVLPVSDGVADVVEERTAAEVEIANKHAAEMADVADVVSAGAEGGEKFDGPHNRHVGTHRNGDRKRIQPDAAVREEDSVGHENAKDSSRGPDGGSYGSQ